MVTSSILYASMLAVNFRSTEYFRTLAEVVKDILLFISREKKTLEDPRLFHNTDISKRKRGAP